MKLRLVLLLIAILTLGAAPAFAAEEFATQLASRGVLLTLLSVFGAGVLVSLTPCVYPMIPITLSIIGARSIGQKPMTGFLRSLTFVLGIAVVYTAIGILAAWLGKGFQFILQNRMFWLFLAAFFVAMGFSMMGAFNLQLPARFSGRMQSMTSGKGGFVGAFLVGIVTGVAASPCGTPVLAGLMAYGASKANMPLVVGMFFSYALGIGMLFLVLGTAPAFLKAMPKSGGWMDDVKKFLGLVLIGMGIYYLQYVFRGAMLWYWVLVALVALAGGAIIAIKAAARKDMPRMMLLERTIGAGLVIFAFYAAVAKVPDYVAARPDNAQQAQPKLTAEKLIAEARAAAMNEQKFTALVRQEADAAAAENSNEAPSASAAGLDSSQPPLAVTDEWFTDEPAALALGKQYNMPVMIDFRADWCAACKELEKKTFPAPKVAEVLKGFIKVKIDATEETETNQALQKKYGALSLPTVTFIDKNGKVREDLKLLTFEPPDAFLERLKKVQQ